MYFKKEKLKSTYLVRSSTLRPASPGSCYYEAANGLKAVLSYEKEFDVRKKTLRPRIEEILLQLADTSGEVKLTQISNFQRNPRSKTGKEKNEPRSAKLNCGRNSVRRKISTGAHTKQKGLKGVLNKETGLIKNQPIFMADVLLNKSNWPPRRLGIRRR